MEDRGMSHSLETKAPTETSSEDWAHLPWRKLERYVFRLQKRIYRASARGNVQAVHRLQQLLSRSRAARLLAVRRVTQDNQGKKTAGVDGVKSLTPSARLALAEAIHPQQWKVRKASPLRRVWIPKPGKAEQRPLGIPVMYDRAWQALAKQALEPEWEARFEPNSYGFRPGRSCFDAIGAIFNSICQQGKYVLDADIEGCFNHIDHQAVLQKLSTYPAMRRAVKSWLKAGVMENLELSPTTEGTPQGGVISPLLANVALHGMEQAVDSAFRSSEGKPRVVRYADDFVIFHLRRKGVVKAQQVVTAWLEQVGLHLKPSKTHITQTLTSSQERGGFDFLGFTIRQHRVGKTHCRWQHGKPLGFKTIITPSSASIQKHRKDLSHIIRANRAAPQPLLIDTLNPVIHGWANYFRTVVAKRAFATCDHWLYQMLRRWARFRHPNKPAKWVKERYWPSRQDQAWLFTAPDGSELRRHVAIPIQRHEKVRDRASPYNGNLVYWVKRLRTHPLLNSEKAKLLKLQRGQCPICGLTFRDEDLLETDHLIPRRLGGKDTLLNKMVYHKHCHDWKTARDGSNQARKGQGTYDTSHLTEEPDARKRARPVLEAGGRS
jgi:RNA-directed DNA polymerase